MPVRLGEESGFSLSDEANLALALLTFRMEEDVTAADVWILDLDIVSSDALAWLISSLWIVVLHRGPLLRADSSEFFTQPPRIINRLFSSLATFS